ncbi:MAG: SUMF1/EgtB/PvdO family nonheme iron enzyme [Panacagrimonas sp.]
MIRWRAGLAMLMAVASTAAYAQEPAAPVPAPVKKARPATKRPVARAATPPAPKTCERLEQALSPQPFTPFRDCSETPEMIRLPSGTFLMGETGGVGHAYEQPVREVSIASFSIGRHETTFFEWDTCHDDGGCQKRPDDEGWGRGFRPVINVDWIDAQQYVAWLSRRTGQTYRLPSEAEWEYAARAGTVSSYSWGDASGEACDFANTLDLSGLSQHPNWTWNVLCIDAFAHTAPVGSFPPNPWGLHDMHGNVWEWVQDCWHSDYTDAPTDGSAWVTGPDCGKRVNRGGGWGNNPRSLRSANRDADNADGSGDAFGFRVVREEIPSPPLPVPQIAEPAKSAEDSAGAAP